MARKELHYVTVEEFLKLVEPEGIPVLKTKMEEMKINQEEYDKLFEKDSAMSGWRIISGMFFAFVTAGLIFGKNIISDVGRVGGDIGIGLAFFAFPVLMALQYKNEKRRAILSNKISESNRIFFASYWGAYYFPKPWRKGADIALAYSLAEIQEANMIAEKDLSYLNE